MTYLGTRPPTIDEWEQYELHHDNVAASTDKMADVDVINADVHKYDNFVWYDASSDFERVDDITFTISTSAAGILGIDYIYESGDMEYIYH